MKKLIVAVGLVVLLLIGPASAIQIDILGTDIETKWSITGDAFFISTNGNEVLIIINGVISVVSGPIVPISK